MWRASKNSYVPQKSVDIPSSNGLSYSTGRTIIVEIPETVGFMSPADSYVKFDLTISEALAAGDVGGAAGQGCSYLKCRPDAGVSALFESVRVYSRRTGELLDSIDEYGTYVAQHLHYALNEPQQAKRAMTEGVEDPQTIVGSAYFLQDAAAAADGTARAANAAAAINPGFTRTTFCMPIRVGMFSQLQAVPVAMLGGLRIEFDTVRQAEKALCRLPGISYSGDANYSDYADGRSTNNPTGNAQPFVNRSMDKLHKVYGVGLDAVSPTSNDFVGAFSCDISSNRAVAMAGCASVASNQNQSPAMGAEAAPAADNTISCPFRVGECVGFVAVDKSSLATAPSPIVVGTTAGGVKIDSIAPLSAALGGGWRITFDAAFTQAAVNVPFGGGTSEITGSLTGAAGSGIDIFLAVPNSVAGSQVEDFDVDATPVIVGTANAPAALVSNSIASSFTIENVSMVAQEIDAPELQARGMKNGMDYSFKAIQNYKVSIPQGFTSTSDILPIANAKCYSVLVIPTAQATYNDNSLDKFDVIHGHMDDLQRYQFQVDGRLQPDRQVECAPVRFNQIMSSQYSYELIKALGASDIPFRTIKSSQGSFIVPLQLGQDRFSYDARGKDFILNQEYGTRTRPLLIKIYVSHERTLKISQAGVVVER